MVKGTSTDQDLSFEPITKSLWHSVQRVYPVQAHTSKNHCFTTFWSNSSPYKKAMTDGRTDGHPKTSLTQHTLTLQTPNFWAGTLKRGKFKKKNAVGHCVNIYQQLSLGFAFGITLSEFHLFSLRNQHLQINYRINKYDMHVYKQTSRQCYKILYYRPIVLIAVTCYILVLAVTC